MVPLGAFLPSRGFRLFSTKTKANIAVAGAGWWAQRNHLPQLSRHSDVNLVAIVEPHEIRRSSFNPDIKWETREQLQQRYACPMFASVDDLLQSDVGRSVDGLVVASSHASHFELGCKALNAGWHVLMEKPMVTEPAQARQLQTLVHSKKQVFLVNNSANWQPQSQVAYELVSSGVIGEVLHASVTMASPLMWLFDDPVHEGWVQPSGSMLGNGFGWGQLSHSLAWILKVASLNPTKVQCTMKKSQRSGADLFDAALISCDNGATLVLQGITTNVIAEQTKVNGKFIDNRIYGSKGSLTYTGNDADPSSSSLCVQTHDGRPVKRVDGSPLPQGFAFEDLEIEGTGPGSVQAFVKGCLGQPYFEGVGVDVGMKAVLVIDAMYRSAASGHAEDCL